MSASGARGARRGRSREPAEQGPPWGSSGGGSEGAPPETPSVRPTLGVDRDRQGTACPASAGPRAEAAMRGGFAVRTPAPPTLKAPRPPPGTASRPARCRRAAPPAGRPRPARESRELGIPATRGLPPHTSGLSTATARGAWTPPRTCPSSCGFFEVPRMMGDSGGATLEGRPQPTCEDALVMPSLAAGSRRAMVTPAAQTMPGRNDGTSNSERPRVLGGQGFRVSGRSPLPLRAGADGGAPHRLPGSVLTELSVCGPQLGTLWLTLKISLAPRSSARESVSRQRISRRPSGPVASDAALHKLTGGSLPTEG